MKSLWTLLTFTMLFQLSEEFRLKKLGRPRGFLFKTKKIKLGGLRNSLGNLDSVLRGTNAKPNVSNLRKNLEKLLSIGGINDVERTRVNKNVKESTIQRDEIPPKSAIINDVSLQQQHQLLENQREQQRQQTERQLIQEQHRQQAEGQLIQEQQRQQAERQLIQEQQRQQAERKLIQEQQRQQSERQLIQEQQRQQSERQLIQEQQRQQAERQLIQEQQRQQAERQLIQDQQRQQTERQLIHDQQRKPPNQQKELLRQQQQKQKSREQKIQERLQRQKERQRRQQLRQQRFKERQERRRLRQQRQRERQKRRQGNRQRNNNAANGQQAVNSNAGRREEIPVEDSSGFNGHRLSHLPCQYVGCVANRVCVMMNEQDPDICDSGTVQACHCARGCVAEYGFLPEGVTKAMGHCRDCTCVNGEVKCIVLDACAHFIQPDPNQGTESAAATPG